MRLVRGQMLEESGRSSRGIVLGAASENMVGILNTKGIYPLRRSWRGGTAKVEEYAPGVSGMSGAI